MNETQVTLTIKDIAEILGVTRATVYNRQAAGDLPAGTGIEVIGADIARREQEIADIRARLSAMITERLVVSV